MESINDFETLEMTEQTELTESASWLKRLNLQPTESGELPTKNPIASHVSSDRLSPSYEAFVHQMAYVVIVSKVEEALHPKVTQAMNEEIEAHKKNYTCDVVYFP